MNPEYNTPMPAEQDVSIMQIDSYKSVSAIYTFVDIRGFSRWAKEYPDEIRDLLRITYSAAEASFGAKTDSRFKRRVAKFLGDGFMAVHEYFNGNVIQLGDAAASSFVSSARFIGAFNELTNRAAIHRRRSLGVGIGMAFGNSYRFRLPGHSFDYVGVQVNLASRMCALAQQSEIVIEEDLYDYIDDDDRAVLVAPNIKLEIKDIKEQKDVRIIRISDNFRWIEKLELRGGLHDLMLKIEGPRDLLEARGEPET